MSIESRLRYRHWLNKSERWQTVRLLCLGWQKMICQGCGKEDVRNDVHHTRYRKRWNDTVFADLRVLCRKCHARIHELTTPEKYSKRQTALDEYHHAIWIIRFENRWEPEIPWNQELAFYKHLKKSRIELINKLRTRIAILTPKPAKRPKIPKCCLCQSVDFSQEITLPHQSKTCKICADCFSYFNKLNDKTTAGALFRYARTKMKKAA